MSKYETNVDEAEAKLRSLLTDEFLSTLVLAINTCGDSVDYSEMEDFARWCFDVAGKDFARTGPLDYSA